MHTRVSSPPGDADPAHEVDDDLGEIRWHIDHVRDRLGQVRSLAAGPVAALRIALEHHVRALDTALCEPGPPAAPPLVRHQDCVRQLYQALALLETAPDWHSAPGSLSHPIRDLAPLSHIPGFNDYQRGYLPWLRGHEQHFAHCSQPDLPGRALLFSSGMGAVQTALQFVLSRARHLLLGKRVYYETQTLLALGGARERLRPLDEAEPRIEILIDSIRGVDAIFVDTVTLDRAALRLDVARIVRAIEASGRTGIDLVVDNTAPGPELQLPPPPSGSQLFVVESLLKNYQAGLDLAASGMLVVVASSDAALDARLVHDLEVLRSTNGTNLSAYAARLLPLVPRDRILARLRRQTRNAGLVAEALRGRCDVHPVNHAGLVFCTHPRAEQLLSVIELLALARRIRVFQGTSFGFNDTRVALVPGQGDQVRFACGMEHEAAARELARVVALAVEAVDAPAVQAACVHLSRFFPDYPRRATPNPEELDALARHAAELERTVLEVTAAT